MAELSDLSATDASNTARFPENMQFRNVNNSARALEGMIAREYKDRNASIAAGGSSNAFTVTSNQTLGAYYDSLIIGFTANHTITGAATVNVSGLGVKSIKREDGSALGAGDIVSGQKVLIIYRSATSDFQLIGSRAVGTILSVGMIAGWPTSSVPTGWLECNGAAVSRTTYADLFGKIGATYGAGDGSTTFNLPDYRGRFLRGHDAGAGIDPDAASRTDRGDGTTGDSVGTKQGDAVDAHTHTASSASDGAHTHTGGSYQNRSVGSSGFSVTEAIGNPGTYGSSWTTSSDGSHTHNITVDSTGGNETRPVNISTKWCILALPASAIILSAARQTASGGVTLANGANNNVAFVNGTNNKMRITGPTGAFSVTGLAAPADDGAICYLHNTVAQDMTIANESASSTAANRIVTKTGSDVTLTGVSFASLIYDTTDARWILMSTQG